MLPSLCGQGAVWNETNSSLSEACSSLTLGYPSFAQLHQPPYVRKSCSFERQSSFTTKEELLRRRHKSFLPRPVDVISDVWTRQPPDFRIQCYTANPPKRNSRESMKPWRYAEIGLDVKHIHEERRIPTPEIRCPKMREHNFLIPIHTSDSSTARHEFVKSGMLRYGHYTDPKLHNFRPDTAGKLEHHLEFATSISPDPYNLKFKSQSLAVIHGLSDGTPPSRDLTGRPLDSLLRHPPKWEARLILTKPPWPIQSTSYSRFRPLFRSPQMALMDRMEKAISEKWQQEKLEAMKKQSKLLPETIKV